MWRQSLMGIVPKRGALNIFTTNFSPSRTFLSLSDDSLSIHIHALLFGVFYKGIRHDALSTPAGSS
jgi:hypothetical protein